MVGSMGGSSSFSLSFKREKRKEREKRTDDPTMNPPLAHVASLLRARRAPPPRDRKEELVTNQHSVWLLLPGGGSFSRAREEQERTQDMNLMSR